MNGKYHATQMFIKVMLCGVRAGDIIKEHDKWRIESTQTRNMPYLFLAADYSLS